MPAQPYDFITIVAAISVFILVLSVWCILVVLWKRRRTKQEETLTQRMEPRGIPEEGKRVLSLWHEGKETTTRVLEKPKRLALFAKLNRLCQDAGFQVPTASLLLGVFGLTTLIFAITLAISHNFLLALAVAVVTISAAWMYLKHCISRRASLFDRQLLDATVSSRS